MPSGSYRVYLSYFLYPGGSLSLTAMTLSYTHSNDVRRIEYGKNGMMLFYNEAGQKNYLYMTNEGLSIGGETDIPGVLFSGSVVSGAFLKTWGAKKSTGGINNSTTGTYIVPIANMTHSNYIVQVTPQTAGYTAAITAKTQTNFTVMLRSASGTAANGNFDFLVSGEN